jgi:hypothetical protein
MRAIIAASPLWPVPKTTSWPNYRGDDFIIADCKFTSGETLPQLKLHYRTLGSAERNAAGSPTRTPGAGSRATS